MWTFQRITKGAYLIGHYENGVFIERFECHELPATVRVVNYLNGGNIAGWVYLYGNAKEKTEVSDVLAFYLYVGTVWEVTR